MLSLVLKRGGEIRSPKSLLTKLELFQNRPELLNEAEYLVESDVSRKVFDGSLKSQMIPAHGKSLIFAAMTQRYSVTTITSRSLQCHLGASDFFVSGRRGRMKKGRMCWLFQSWRSSGLCTIPRVQSHRWISLTSTKCSLLMESSHI